MLVRRITILKGFGSILERLNRISFLRWLLELDDIVNGNGDFDPFTPANLYYAIAQSDESYQLAIDDYMSRINDLSFKEE